MDNILEKNVLKLSSFFSWASLKCFQLIQLYLIELIDLILYWHIFCYCPVFKIDFKFESFKMIKICSFSGFNYSENWKYMVSHSIFWAKCIFWNERMNAVFSQVQIHFESRDECGHSNKWHIFLLSSFTAFNADLRGLSFLCTIFQIKSVFTQAIKKELVVINWTCLLHYSILDLRL